MHHITQQPPSRHLDLVSEQHAHAVQNGRIGRKLCVGEGRYHGYLHTRIHARIRTHTHTHTRARARRNTRHTKAMWSRTFTSTLRVPRVAHSLPLNFSGIVLAAVWRSESSAWACGRWWRVLERWQTRGWCVSVCANLADLGHQLVLDKRRIRQV